MLKTIGLGILGVLALTIASFDALASLALPANPVQRPRARFYKKG